jgi:hypothetical protein
MRNLLRSMILRVAAATLGLALLVSSVGAADTQPEAISARDLAARLSAIWQDGASYVRLLLSVKQPPDTTKVALQLQIKERRTRETTDVIY